MYRPENPERIQSTVRNFRYLLSPATISLLVASIATTVVWILSFVGQFFSVVVYGGMGIRLAFVGGILNFGFLPMHAPPRCEADWFWVDPEISSMTFENIFPAFYTDSRFGERMVLLPIWMIHFLLITLTFFQLLVRYRKIRSLPHSGIGKS